MGHRLSKIYTRTGDDGSTGLGDGTRVRKDHARVEAFGTVDELNSVLGLLLTEELPAPLRAALLDIQHELFDLGGELCVPGRAVISESATAPSVARGPRLDPISDAQVTRLEELLDDLNSGLAPLKEFILPGGTRAATLAHLARTVCRRAERRAITLHAIEPVPAASLKYLNRLSDLLFVLARSLNTLAGEPDVLWQPGKTKT
jgi:cob(I)alamin adenosyltransferase